MRDALFCRGDGVTQRRAGVASSDELDEVGKAAFFLIALGLHPALPVSAHGIHLRNCSTHSLNEASEIRLAEDCSA
jgi:hypothetical protein